MLSVEPISLRGENIDNSTIIPGFQKAEEKSVKAIQKHSMNIKGYQKNLLIDDAYILLGKSRYFDRRDPGKRPFCLIDYFPDDFMLFRGFEGNM